MMQNLIERLQSATASDRELDLRVAQALGVKITEYEIISEGQTWKAYDDAWPRYTSSIDAALTLVPKDCSWSLDGDNYAIVMPSTGNEDYDSGENHIATPAIALCIAALKAHQSMETK